MMRAHQVNQRAWEVEELEGQLQKRKGQLQEWEGQRQEREELDDITLHRELEVLSTRETNLECREAKLERWRSGRCRSWPSPRRGWRTSRPPELGKDNASGASWARQTLL
jgi:hypothetical protein